MTGARTCPPGDYAIVELFGHTTLVGRVAEIERFGAKMLALEPLYGGALLPTVYHGGAAIYRLTPCSSEIAFARQPREPWQIPAPIRAVLPAALLDPPPPSAVDADIGPDDDERGIDGEGDAGVINRDFTAGATRTLSTAREGDTIIVAVLQPGDSMVMHVAGRDARHLTHVARRLLEEAEDALQAELGADDCCDQGDHPSEQLLSSVLEALECLPGQDDED